MKRLRLIVAAGISCLLICGSVCEAGRIGFVVSEYPGDTQHGDSYVITIDESDAARLEHARALVAWIQSGANLDNAPDGRIVFTNLAAGADGINRDVLAAGEPAWSWHTTGDVDFVDISAEIYDGWPTFVEQDVQGWIANTNGAVGFWSYTVTQELGVVPEPSALALAGTGTVLLVRRRR
jgi:hypothetical protein